MNILIMADYYPPGRLGGIGEVAAGLYQAYRNLGHTVYVLSSGVAQPGERERGIWRSHTRLIPGVLINNLRALRMIRKFKIELVHMQQASSTLFLLAASRGDRPYILSTLHVSYADEARQVTPYRLLDRTFQPLPGEYLERVLTMPVHRLLDGIGLRRADCITVMSREASDSLPATRAPVAIVPNGFTMPAILPEPRRDAALLAFIGNRRVVAFSGSFRSRKRLPLLLLALQQLVHTHPQVVLLVLGGGHGYEKSIAQLVRELKLEKHVWLAGHLRQAQVLQHLRLVDILCMVSTLEGMPIALLEAMALGLAVIGTRIPGNMDAIDDGESGLLVNVDDVGDLAAALRRLLNDETLRHRLGQAAARRVRESFNWDVIARKYLALMEATK